MDAYIFFKHTRQVAPRDRTADLQRYSFLVNLEFVDFVPVFIALADRQFYK